MKRVLRLSLEVDEASPVSCGGCPFRSLDWEGGEPRGREVCTCPAWELPDVTGGVRHADCMKAEAP